MKRHASYDGSPSEYQRYQRKQGEGSRNNDERGSRKHRGGGGGGGGGRSSRDRASGSNYQRHTQSRRNNFGRRSRRREENGTRSRSRSRDCHRARARRRRRRSISSSPYTESASYSNSHSRSHSHSDSESSSNQSYDDSEGRIRIKSGEFIGSKGRYEVLGVAGEGTFGTVLNVVDTKYDEPLAVKVVRSVTRYLEAAKVEEDILRRIRREDPDKESLCVRFKNKFDITFRGKKHVCLGFERLGKSLYGFLKSNHYRGFRMAQVRVFGYQLLKAVKFCHSIRLIHTDLKPENILLEDSDYKYEKQGTHSDYRVPLSERIRLIDFGGATFEDDHHSRIINTRQYRSPEVMFGLGWSYPSDLWSVGCILAELYTGDLLFKTHEDMEHLALMEKIVGPLPQHMCLAAEKLHRRDENSSSSHRGGEHKRSKRRGRSTSRPRVSDWVEKGRIRWPENASGKSSLTKVRRARHIKAQFRNKEYVDLLLKLLQHDPKERISAKEAMRHPFFKNIVDRNGNVHLDERT